MKSKFLSIIVALLSAITCYSQTIDTNSQEFHLKKRKANKTGGWILVSAGTAAVVGGVLLDFDQNFHIFETDPPPYNHTGITIAYIGGGMILGSIPCFISARKHKKLAQASVALKNIRMPDGNLSYDVQPVVSVSIQF